MVVLLDPQLISADHVSTYSQTRKVPFCHFFDPLLPFESRRRYDKDIFRGLQGRVLANDSELTLFRFLIVYVDSLRLPLSQRDPSQSSFDLV